MPSEPEVSAFRTWRLFTAGTRVKHVLSDGFCAESQPEYRFAKGEVELMTLAATDVLAEGLNLQDCDNIHQI